VCRVYPSVLVDAREHRLPDLQHKLDLLQGSGFTGLFVGLGVWG